jgi:hypothetical protein
MLASCLTFVSSLASHPPFSLQTRRPRSSGQTPRRIRSGGCQSGNGLPLRAVGGASSTVTSARGHRVPRAFRRQKQRKSWGVSGPAASDRARHTKALCHPIPIANPLSQSFQGVGCIATAHSRHRGEEGSVWRQGQKGQEGQALRGIKAPHATVRRLRTH